MYTELPLAEVDKNVEKHSFIYSYSTHISKPLIENFSGTAPSVPSGKTEKLMRTMLTFTNHSQCSVLHVPTRISFKIKNKKWLNTNANKQ